MRGGIRGAGMVGMYVPSAAEAAGAVGKPGAGDRWCQWMDDGGMKAGVSPTRRSAVWRLRTCLLLLCKLQFTCDGGLSLSARTIVQRGNFKEYVQQQRTLKKNQAPHPSAGLGDLLKPDSEYAFVDNSPYILETCNEKITLGKTILIRPRRFGKTTFGRLWLEFFSGNKRMFQDLSIKNDQPEPSSYVCVNLDISGASCRTFQVRLVRALNKGLSAAQLKQIDSQCAEVDMAIILFADVVGAGSKRAAIFIDEYDSMVLRSSRAEYQEALDLTEKLFVCLKAVADVIPFVLIAGSSRIPISGLWSGGNDIEDLSYADSMASVLGYTWEQIAHVFSVQLDMLQQLHGLSAEDLKDKTELMYSGYRFSPTSDDVVFNPWAINRLMQTGMFQSHLAMSGLSQSLATGSLPATTISALSVPGNVQPAQMEEIVAWRYTPELASEPLSVWVQLLCAGLLTFAKGLEDVVLKVPNDDARFALTQVLPAFAQGISQETFSTMIAEEDIPGAVQLLQPQLQDVATQLAANAAGAAGLLEYHLQKAFFALAYALWRRTRTDTWRVTSEVRVQRDGKSPRVDFLLATRANQVEKYYVLEFGRCVGRGSAALRAAVLDKLGQAEDKYFNVARNEAATLLMVIIWSREGELLFTAGPFSKDEVTKKRTALKDTEDEQWQKLL